jgi:hypothetical protein
MARSTPAVIAMAAGLAAAPLEAAPVERFSAVAVSLSVFENAGPVGTVDIGIERWSTDAERDRFLDAMRAGGPAGLQEALRQAGGEAGVIRSDGSGYPIRFARERTLADGTRRILLATDRPVALLEAAAREATPADRLTDPVALVELRVNEHGEGVGRVLPSTRVTADDDDVIGIADYASEPIRLTPVESVASGPAGPEAPLD